MSANKRIMKVGPGAPQSTDIITDIPIRSTRRSKAIPHPAAKSPSRTKAI